MSLLCLREDRRVAAITAGNNRNDIVIQKDGPASINYHHDTDPENFLSEDGAKRDCEEDR